MCGITGVVDFQVEHISVETISKMTDVMAYRGPDDSGFHFGPHVGLGHRRLSIIDLGGGKQPMYSERGRSVIVFNGEIYNFEEVRRHLESVGAEFRTKSDTEVLLKSYEFYDVKCLDLFRGMFAFAIWDIAKKKLFIARDRLGKKPLYYFLTGEKLIFGSEIKCILAAGEIERRVNVEAVDAFLSLGYTLAPQTVFENIQKLPAAHYLLFDQFGLTTKRYWRLYEQDAQPKISLEEGIQSLREILSEAVSLRMISDVPVGAFLSGGLDSSIIVGLMGRLSERPVKTFTIGYEDAPAHSELEYAKVVAKHFKTDHTEIILKPRRFLDLVKKMVYHLEEPIGDQACIPLFMISEQAKKEVTVMLSGEGADELFGGYNIYVLMKFLDQYRKVPRPLRKYILNPLLRMILDSRRATKYIEWSEKELSSRYLGDMADLSDGMKGQLYTKDFKDHVSHSYRNSIHDIYSELPNGSAVDKMTYLDIRTWLVENLLLKADKMTMAASVELRTPFLDHKLVEASRRLLPNCKINGSRKKYILKEAYKDFLPKEIICRAKRGFPVPLSIWFKENMNDLIADILLDQSARQRGYFNYDFIRHMIRDQEKGRVDYSKVLWNLVVLEFWHREFVG